MRELGENILCISSIDWDFIWQGHQEIMSSLARQGCRVLFIENTGVRAPGLRDLPRLQRRLRNWSRGIGGIREEAEGLYVFSPVVLPFPYSRLARMVNRRVLVSTIGRWMRATDFTDPIIWTFLPTQLTLDLAEAISHKLLIYYCIDSFSDSSPYARRIRRTEQRLIAQADVVFVTSQELLTSCGRLNPDTHLFPFGVSLTRFERAVQEPQIPADLAGIPRPRVGYVGGIHKWVDQSLVHELSVRHPDCAFVFVGPVQTAHELLARRPNVHFLGQKPQDDIPHYIANFDCCMIPYRLTEYTRNVYPTKLNEYLAMGKPVVSTALPEVLRFNQEQGAVVSVGADVEAFEAALTSWLRNGGDAAAVARRRSAARDNGWEARIAAMCDLVAPAVERRRRKREQGWKEALLAWYRRALRRTAWGALAALGMYLVLFHTPLLWWAASPLKLSEVPRQADAVVVFAGGVGESGKAGQGYEERVAHAVSLYRAGYAPRMIFSSGYRYAMREAEVMRALALSLGVAPEAVLLEEQARNTYENVMLSTQVLRQHGGRSALVVSSPYHMRRVALVYRRVAPDVEAVLTPLHASQFYGNGARVRLQHYQAILHEYAAILYYWWKGWL